MENFENREYYINRELSWLSFNQRVLDEALDTSNPLLERLKFLAISCSNLDEFFMVRVAGIIDQLKIGYTKPENKAGLTPQEQFDAVSQRAHEMVDKMYTILNQFILPLLREEGIRFLKPSELTMEQHEFVTNYYNNSIFPVLTPMAIDASHPFPHLLNKSLNLAVLLQSERETKPLFAVVQVPSVLPRYIRLPSDEGQLHFMLLEDLICQNMESLFQGNEILEVTPFRITRDADITLDEEEAEDLLEAIENELKKRKLGVEVRLELSAAAGEVMYETIKEMLEMEQQEIYVINGPLDPTFFMKFQGSLPGYDHLRFEEMRPQMPIDLVGEDDIFEAIREKDIMLAHPFESFDPVTHFVQQAAEDPNVLAIKQTLYRVSGDSPIVAALARAAENGKQVTVLVEIKARFDEENNIVWAKKLEQSGCHVIYGLVGLKTHSKITLIARREGDTIRRYVHLGTGNYNDTTARIYTDIGIFTCREEFGYDASAFFNHLTGYATTPNWKQLVTAPIGMKEAFIRLVENEIANSTEASPGHIIAQMNSLTDKDIMKALFKASMAGVKIDLIVRGICCLRPGIPGVSENINVYSIVGRFLEHSRIFYFKNGGDEKVFLSSADWMTRNMEYRVEILFPVVQENLKERIKNILDIKLSDNVKRHKLESNGTYSKVKKTSGVSLESQTYLYQQAQQSVSKERQTHFFQLKPKSHV